MSCDTYEAVVFLGYPKRASRANCSWCYPEEGLWDRDLRAKDGRPMTRQHLPILDSHVQSGFNVSRFWYSFGDLRVWGSRL